MINLTEKEKYIIEDLKSQEKLCIQKYAFYEEMAYDPELADLFAQIRESEEKHYNSLNALYASKSLPISFSAIALLYCFDGITIYLIAIIVIMITIETIPIISLIYLFLFSFIILA